MHKAIIGDRGTESEALYEHKAFTFWPGHPLLAIPVDLCEHVTPPPADEPWSYGTPTFHGLYVYRITTDAGFELLGRIGTRNQAVTRGAARWAQVENIAGSVQSLFFEP